MAKETFSSKIKSQLGEEIIKKKCCKYTVNAVLSARGRDDAELLSTIYSKCRCETCRDVFVRALFMICGSVTDPEKSYHLDFTFKNEAEALAMQEILAERGQDFRLSVRREKFVLYIKESSAIEDFLVYIGASAAAFEVMNSKIVHEFRGSVNRQVNCDTANIGKQLAAVKKIKKAVEVLVDTGKYDTLPPEIREAARLRIENDQLSIEGIAALANPPVTKSGMKHRLEKLQSIASSALEETKTEE